MAVVKDNKRLKRGMYINGVYVFKHKLSSYAKGKYCFEISSAVGTARAIQLPRIQMYADRPYSLRRFSQHCTNNLKTKSLL
jgi:hypothetical protein